MRKNQAENDNTFEIPEVDNLGIALKRYGLMGLIRLSRDIILSRLISSKVRLVRYPYYLRGVKGIEFGEGFTSGVGLRIDAFGNGSQQVKLGENVQVGDYVHIGAVRSVEIGDNTLIASKVYISDHDHGTYGEGALTVTLPTQLQSQKMMFASPVRIGKNVWLGENVCVLKGVSIGDNSIIGAASVVNRSIPPNSIAVGVPAKVIKQFDFNQNAWVPIAE